MHTRGIKKMHDEKLMNLSRAIREMAMFPLTLVRESSKGIKCVVKVSMPETMEQALSALREKITQMGFTPIGEPTICSGDEIVFILQRT